jgi:purine-nucleoside phosphorylase
MHYYEGHAVYETTYPIRIMRLLGVQTLIVTNAAGGLHPDFKVGDFMLIQDHVSFAGMGGVNALIGSNVHEIGTRFPPVSDAYDFDLRVMAAQAAKELQLTGLREGTYVFVTGPSFETRAEARFLRDACKADCVGMSTVPEVVVAKHAGMKVLGISMITNNVSVSYGRSAIKHVAGIVEEKGDETKVATHEEVLQTSRERSVIFTAFVKKIVNIYAKQ